jgi:HK97 family phage major capsid protein
MQTNKSAAELAAEVKASIAGHQRQTDLRLDDIEQKLARGGGGNGGGNVDSWGREFVEAKASGLSDLRQNRGRMALNIKAAITSTTGAGLLVPARDQVLGMPKRRLAIRDLLMRVNVTTGSVEYPKVTTRPTAADMVAEGAIKPESSMEIELATVPIRTIAHWIPASLQVLDDAPQLQSLIDDELRYGLAIKEESQLLFGDGTGQNLSGMVTEATAFSNPIPETETNMIDVIGAAILQAALTEVPVDGVVINPVDWWRMRLLKDDQGKYILGDPGSDIPPVLFGLPVVPTQAMLVDKFLVGGFASQTLYDRWEARVEVSTEHADFFTRNLMAIRAEERIGLAVKRPEALIYGDFGNV